MPLEGQRLVVEPTYPKAAELAKIGAPKEEPLPADVRIRNQFWCRRRRADVLIWEEGGKIEWGIEPRGHRLPIEIETLACSAAWGIEQEGRAVQLLGTLLRHHQFKTYLLTGAFLETSKRSGITYLFRKLRPTIAMNARDETRPVRVLAALCLHPIAYYAGTWAGAMCPTDDVIAHLMLMRGDEPMFWRRSNQHPPDRPEAGL